MNPADMDERAIVDLGQTPKIAAQFREADTTAALLQATTWLDSIERTPDLSLERRYDSVNLLDTSTRKHQKQIVDDYLALMQANRKQEKLLWETAHGFWVALSAAYIECMAHALVDLPSCDTLKTKLPALAARGARAVAMQMKWLWFRFGLVEPWVWMNLALCQKFAESHQIADKATPLYLSNPTKSSPNQEFLRAVMLSASSTDSLSVMEQEIADRWIEHFTSTFKMAPQPGIGLNLYFDLDRELPPRRVVGTPATTAHRRFFGASGALPQVQEYLESTRKTGVTPVPFRLPKDCDTKHVLRVLDHFALHWKDDLPAREWDRRLTATCIEVKHDYGSVWRTLENAENGELDFTDSIARPEYWVVDNAGRGGYRAIVPKGLRAWLRLGALIAIRLEFRDFWSIAVIRRVESDEHQQRKVGIRIIARRPVTALMHSKIRARTHFKPAHGILLNTKPSHDGGVHVLMRPGTFTLNDDIDVTFGPSQQTMSLTPSRVVETTIEYEWLRYTVKK